MINTIKNTDVMTTQKTLPSQVFDVSFDMASDAIRTNRSRINQTMANWGVNLQTIQALNNAFSQADAEQKIKQLHDSCAMIFLQWQVARDSQDRPLELALARVFNSLTKNARSIHCQYPVFDTAHLAELEQSLKTELQIEQKTHVIDLEYIARALAKAAAQRTHENAWAWVVLPTFPRQHYGRILLLKIETADKRYPIFVTQPFFLNSEATQFHTHGQNWAFATPLGCSSRSTAPNTHINTLWLPNSPEQAFPLKLLDKKHYSSGTVAVIPPKLIHAINGVRAPELPFSLEQLTQNRALLLDQIAHLKFAEKGSLHIYRPDVPLTDSLTQSPFFRQQNDFFMENEMIVFDHWTKTIWAGCGGAWAKRMIQLGPTGEHCATCFSEDDHRVENLDPKQVYEWLIQDPPPELITFS